MHHVQGTVDVDSVSDTEPDRDLDAILKRRRSQRLKSRGLNPKSSAAGQGAQSGIDEPVKKKTKGNCAKNSRNKRQTSCSLRKRKVATR